MLNQSLLLLAELDPRIMEAKPGKGFTLNFRDTMLIVGVSVGLALILFLWAYFSRRRRRLHSHSHSHSSSEHSDHEVVHSSSGKVRYRKKRRRHPDRLPRNPSLGETGGLPPPRPES